MPRIKSAFTLIEVNLAIFILGTGVLALCILFSLGYRENSQSVEDLAASAAADALFAPLVQGLSATNMPWSSWIEIGDRYVGADGLWPKNGSDYGWRCYLDTTAGGDYRISTSARTTADKVYTDLLSKVPASVRGNKPSLDSKFTYGLVVLRNGPVVQIGFRLSRRRDMLLGQPIFVAEVRFQGDPEK